MLKYTYTLVLFTLFLASLSAQPLREVPYETMIETADEAFQSGDYYNAGEWYEKAYKEQKNKDFAIKVAECNFKMRDYKRAVSWYQRVITRDKTGVYQDYKLEYGKALKIMGEYNDAYTVLNEFVAASDDIDRKKEAALLINGIAKSNEFEENVDAIIKSVGRKINSASSEAGPKSYGDEIYYSSLNRKDAIIYNNQLEGETHFKIYTSSLNDKGAYKKGTALSDEINREGYHTGNPSFSADGERMYYTRTLIEDGELLESKLYYSKRVGNGWGAGDEVSGEINGDYILKYPAVGELFGKKVMFFSADIEGGFGGLDIYYSESQGGDSYGAPINLGESINTSYDDITPFYRDGELTYSTEGKPGYGGMDIFKTSWNGSNWSEVVNMGNGYNSTYDDMYYTMNPEGTQGYLVSNRVVEGKRSVKSKTCCDDIYAVNMREVVINLLALVTDGENPLMEAEVTLIDMSVGEGKNGPENKLNLKSNDFNFGLDQDKPYKVLVTRKGYFPDSLEFNTVGILDDYTVERTIALKEMPPPPPPPVITETIVTNQPIRMNNIYYDLNSAKILPAAEEDLNFILGLMQKYPDMVIELGSHTDAQGLTRSNQALSQRRSDSAKSWLTAKGVDPNRIQAVGYGESVILNRCVNGVKCSDDEHRFNRRTEFKIISGPTSIEIIKTKTVDPSGGLPMNYDKDAYSQTENTSLKFTENEYQIGEIKLGEKVNMEFEYENTGDVDLIIEVMTACHCTAFEYDKEPLKPGEKAKIYVTYDSGVKQKTGDFREAINIICNTENLVEEAIFHVKVVE